MNLRQIFNTLKEKNDQKRLNELYDRYEFLFIMPAKTLTKEIVSVLKKSNKDIKIYPVYEVEGNLYELQGKTETEQLNKTISTSVSVKDKYSTHKITLLKNATAKTFDELKSGEYEINVFDLLLNDNIENAEHIHLACWKAIANNIKSCIEEQDEEKII